MGKNQPIRYTSNSREMLPTTWSFIPLCHEFVSARKVLILDKYLPGSWISTQDRSHVPNRGERIGGDECFQEVSPQPSNIQTNSNISTVQITNNNGKEDFLGDGFATRRKSFSWDNPHTLKTKCGVELMSPYEPRVEHDKGLVSTQATSQLLTST